MYYQRLDEAQWRLAGRRETHRQSPRRHAIRAELRANFVAIESFVLNSLVRWPTFRLAKSQGTADLFLMPRNRNADMGKAALKFCLAPFDHLRDFA